MAGAGEDRRRTRRSAAGIEEEGDDHVTTTCATTRKGGCHCQSCAAGVIADCVAVCCCPCGVVSILVLTFVRLPWAVARRWVGRRRRRRRKGKVDGIWGKGAAEAGMAETVESLEELNYDFSPGFKLENDDVWVELYEFGHWGFGRLSFTGTLPFPNRGS